MKIEDASDSFVMAVSSHVEFGGNHIGYDKKDKSDNTRIHKRECHTPAIYTFPLQYIINERLVQELFSINNDHLYAKIWLSYCQNPTLKNTLRNIYSDHCYSDIPELDFTDYVDLPESSSSDSDDADSSSLSYQEPLKSYVMASSAITEWTFTDCDDLTEPNSSDYSDMELDDRELLEIDMPPLSPILSDLEILISSNIESALSRIDNSCEFNPAKFVNR